MIEVDGPIEIREYPDLIVATTPMQIESQGNDGSFMRLFRYISGANRAQQKVAMTTPVFMEPELDNDEGKMGFVMPREFARQEVPIPSHADVRIEKRPQGRFAVLRFAGRMNEENRLNAEESLRQWMKTRSLTSNGDAEFAGYDPPWTPGPLRRNEVLVRIEHAAAHTPIGGAAE